VLPSHTSKGKWYQITWAKSRTLGGYCRAPKIESSGSPGELIQRKCKSKRENVVGELSRGIFFILKEYKGGRGKNSPGGGSDFPVKGKDGRKRGKVV